MTLAEYGYFVVVTDYFLSILNDGDYDQFMKWRLLTGRLGIDPNYQKTVIEYFLNGATDEHINTTIVNVFNMVGPMHFSDGCREAIEAYMKAHN